MTSALRAPGEELDSLRNGQLLQHPGLTLTGIYNVLEMLRGNEPLTARERAVHEQG